MSPKAPKILLVEDEKSHQLIIKKSLEGFYELDIASSITEAEQLTRKFHYDVFLLDIMLPDGSGFDLISNIRKEEKNRLTPVLFLTVREDLKSKLLGFSLGADDYLIKPAEPLELRARIDAKIRKINEILEVSQANLIQVDELVLDLDKQSVWLLESGQKKELDLTRLEFKLFLFFVKNPNSVFSRSDILKAVWGEQTHVLDRSVDSYVAALRRKLGAKSTILKSVHDVGYRLEPSTHVKRAI